MFLFFFFSQVLSNVICVDVYYNSERFNIGMASNNLPIFGEETNLLRLIDIVLKLLQVTNTTTASSTSNCIAVTPTAEQMESVPPHVRQSDITPISKTDT